MRGAEGLGRTASTSLTLRPLVRYMKAQLRLADSVLTDPESVLTPPNICATCATWLVSRSPETTTHATHSN